MTALSQAPVGETQEVKWIMANENDRETISSIGIEPGSKVTVVSSILGNVIVAVNNMRYALSSDIAYRIKLG